MANFTFRGGIHPYDGKELTKDKPVKRFKPEGELIFPFPSISVHRQRRW